MAKYRKKPVVIEAIQWDGKNWDEVHNFMQEFHGHKKAYEDAEEGAMKTGNLFIRTLEGTMTATKGDWIIKGVNGEFYPCKPDIFEKTYSPIDESTEQDAGNQDELRNMWIDVAATILSHISVTGSTDDAINELKQKDSISKNR